MGNSNSSQNIGFKYFLGIHAVLAQNKLRILGLKFGEKTAWQGSRGGGESIAVNNKELFGGSDSEGGVSGSIDVLDGDAAQAKNSYLQGAIGGVISAYRGVTSLVFKQFYFGNNPYLKRMAIKAIDVEAAGAWNADKAYLNIEVELSRAEIYISMDVSASMVGVRFTYMKNAVKDYIESLKGTVNTIRLVAWNTAVVETTVIADCSDADYDTLKSWIDSMSAPLLGTSFAAGVSLTTAFFSADSATEFEGSGILENEGETGSAASESINRIVLFMTDGAPTSGQSDVDAALVTLNALTGVDVYCFNIDDSDIQYTLQIDSTPDDGVPVISSSDSGALIGSLQTPFIKWADMNAAHILRDAIVYANGGDASIIGDTFETVANTFYDEGMGLSLFWRNTLTHEQFMDDVKAHVDCVTYPDRTTGKMEIKGIRNDYSVGALHTFDKTNVAKWHDDIGRPLQKDLPNQITVVYTKRENGSEASITVANIAAIQQVGRVIPAKIKYEGITNDTLAGKVVMRDLSARTVPLLSGSIDATYAPLDLNIGSEFIVNNPDFGIDNVVVRVTAREETGGIKPRTTLTFLEDKFDMPATATVAPDAVVVSNKTALNAPYRLFEEVGYYTLVLDQSASTIDDLLTENPDYGIVALAGSKPNNFHSSMDTATNSGAGWVLINSGGFMPASTLIEPLLATDTVSFDVVDNDTLRQVVAGSLCLVDDEIIRVDNMVISGDNVTMTVGRGCLDTIPAQHLAGAAIMFFDGYAQNDPTTYVSGEVIEGKILTKTSAGRLSLDDAVTEQVTLGSRAIRPYPVGNLKMDGAFHPTGILDASVPITWAHRDRTLQLTTAVEDYEDASIGPETGVEYTVEVRSILMKDDIFLETNIFETLDVFAEVGSGTLIRSASVGQLTLYNYDEAGVADFFSKPDFFGAGVTDFFDGDAAAVNLFSVGDIFDTDALPDVFAVVAGRAILTNIMVNVDRDGYDNWTKAGVVGKHMQPPRGLRAEAVL